MLTGKQKRFLRALGTGLDPIVQIGKGGVNAKVITQIDEALEARELIKIRVLTNSENGPKEIAPQIAEQLQSQLVQIVGRNFLIYRKSTKKDIIELPR